MKEVLEAAGKSLWKEVRELALKKGTEAFVVEGVKSVLEIVKRRRIRKDEYDFAEWKKLQQKGQEKGAKTEVKSTATDEPKETPEEAPEESSDEPEPES